MNAECQRCAQYGTLLMTICLFSGCDRRSEKAEGQAPRGKDTPADARRILEQPIPEETNAKVALALRVAQALKRLKGDNDAALNTCVGALEQPQFTGTVGREGAVVLFDERDEPLGAMTTREIDYETGAHFQARPYTEEELRESADQLKSYHALLKSRGIGAQCIVIFSQSFRLAACDVLLNKDKSFEYALRSSLLTKSAQLVRCGPTGSKVIASEVIYYRSELTE